MGRGPPVMASSMQVVRRDPGLHSAQLQLDTEMRIELRWSHSSVAVSASYSRADPLSRAPAANSTMGFVGVRPQVVRAGRSDPEHGGSSTIGSTQLPSL
ncbi:hypothetical protein NDU88_006829 [Pleurodeles waltl]|uniref:Uncharacterized protein n=1 Tax=Pleurodeles waltl TaxID=8319 RepID=A0AAV7SQY8_PLEWA|nr:hypothetical protein NDU88_006829 [Pleurodeles waltl]